MRLNSSTVKVETPDGTLYLIVMENSLGKPERVDIQIGKSGTQIRAWSTALADMINLSLANGIPILTIAANLIGTATDRSRDNAEGSVSSGPEGVVYGIFSYLRYKQIEDTGKPYFNFSRLR